MPGPNAPLGYYNYTRGMPLNPAGYLTPSYADPRGATGAPILGGSTLTPPSLMRAPTPATPRFRREGQVPAASAYRYQAPGPVGGGLGVAAMTPQLWNRLGLGGKRQAAINNPYGSQLANVPNPLFGRPGFSYVYARPAPRFGPALKGSVGTGNTAGVKTNRALGFVPASHAAAQHMPMDQFDYTPPTNEYVGIANEANNSALPRSIFMGNDGLVMLGTYRAHDFTPADRFFKQMRSASYWQDQSFGPNYRDLLGPQQVARYNLYRSMALANPLTPNDYFLGYTTQPYQAAQIGGSGMGGSLGY